MPEHRSKHSLKMLLQASEHKDAWAEIEAEPGDVAQASECIDAWAETYTEPGDVPQASECIDAWQDSCLIMNQTKSLSKFESYCLAKKAHTNMLKWHIDFLFRTSYALQNLKVRIHTTHSPILREKWVVQCGSWSSVTQVQLCSFHSGSGKWRN